MCVLSQAKHLLGNCCFCPSRSQQFCPCLLDIVALSWCCRSFFGKWRSLGCLTFEKKEFNYVLRKCFRNIIFGRRRVIVRPRNQNKFQKRGWGIKIEKLSSGKCCGTRSMGFMGTSVGACGCAQPHYTQCQRIGGIFQIRFWMDFFRDIWHFVDKGIKRKGALYHELIF